VNSRSRIILAIAEGDEKFNAISLHCEIPEKACGVPGSSKNESGELGFPSDPPRRFRLPTGIQRNTHVIIDFYVQIAWKGFPLEEFAGSFPCECLHLS
jgi:hypothetical protein